MLVIEGSIPNENINGDGYWTSFGNDQATGEPLTLNWWIDRLAPKAWGVVAIGTCATYGGIHAMAGNPTGCMGLADYLGWDFRSAGGLPIVNVPGCPVQPENFMETLTWLLYQAAGLAPVIPLDDAAAPAVAVRQDRARGLRPRRLLRAGRLRQDYNSPKCQVKIGCWGPVVNCNVPKRGWMAGIGGCPNVGGICIGCTMPGFPDKFMPFMDAPPGGGVSSAIAGAYGPVIRKLRGDHQQDGEQGAEVAPQPRRADHRLRAPLGQLRRRPRWPLREKVDAGGRQDRRHVLGSDHPDRRQPRHLHEDRLRQPRGRVVQGTSSLFRGYSVFMKGKDPRDAHFITSRICGICGDNHAVCSCYAQQMAYGVKPPPLAEWIVNLGEAAEYIFDHIIFQDNLVFVDFCEQMVKETNPSVLGEGREDRGAAAPSVHGYRTIGDIMRSYNPFTGETYREALHMSRIGREMICLMEGRHVHPSTIYPGGVGTVADADAVHRLPEPAAALPRLHQEGRRDERRRLRLLLRGAAGLRGGRPAAHPARLLGRVQQPRPRRLRLPRTWTTGATRCSSPRASSSTASW